MKTNFIMALRSLFKRGRQNGIKILSLGIPLAMGLTLIAKVSFERSFDSFYPDSDRLYMVLSNLNDGGRKSTWGSVSGAIAPAMHDEIPEIEAASRYTAIGMPGERIVTSDNRLHLATFLLADTCFFDLLPRPVLVGDPHKLLSRPDHVIISRSLAERLGGVAGAVGQSIRRESDRGKSYVVGGVFEDVPENSHLRYDIIGSLNGLPARSTAGWMGNERYVAYVRLCPGVPPESLAPAIRRMQSRHQDLDAMRREGVDLTYTLVPLRQIHVGVDSVRQMNLMLSLMAAILIIIAVLNYILAAVSTLMGRIRQVAVHKCYGASGRDLLGMILSEVVLHLALALALAFMVLLLFRDKTEELLSVSLPALFTPSAVALLAGVCAVVFALTCLVPTRMLMRVPVAFRVERTHRRHWKLALLFVQFAAVAYLAAMLVVIDRQYDKMLHSDYGYACQNLLYCMAEGTDPLVRHRAVTSLGALPQVEAVGCCSELPFFEASGNDVYACDDDSRLFNAADKYFVTENFFSLMEIPVLEGAGFVAGDDNAGNIMVSRKFAEMLNTATGQSGSPIGRRVRVTEHDIDSPAFTICGVYENILIGSLKEPDTRPSMFFCATDTSYAPAETILIKLKDLTPDNVSLVAATLRESVADRPVDVSVYSQDLAAQYNDDRAFRDSMLISGLVALAIALTGLWGYTSDQIRRRIREITIRKINGAEKGDILRMISKDVSYVALPALVTGVAAAYTVASGWLERFVVRVALSPAMFAAVAVSVYAIIVWCVLWRAYRAAAEPPARGLKTE